MKNFKYYIFIMAMLLTVSTKAQFGISAKGGAYIPVGEFADDYKSGFGGEVTFLYRTNPKFELGITTGYSHYVADEDVLRKRLFEEHKADLEQINIDAVVDVEAPIHVFPLVFNIKYFFGNKKFNPFFFFEGGLFYYNLTTKGRVEITNGPNFKIPTTVEKKNSTMIGIGGGTQVRITKKLFFDFSLKWNIMNNIKLVKADTNEELRGVDRTVQTFDILGGLSYYF